MTRFSVSAIALLAGLALFGPAFADGPIAKAKNAVDPDCTPTKAAKGAAMKATVGIGNRCGVAETARDTAGVDGKKIQTPGEGGKKASPPLLPKPSSGN
jgi:hypothetical protein